MSALAWFAIWTLGVPTVYIVGLTIRERRRAPRENQTQNMQSVATIAARLEQERKQTERPIRWPQVDRDRNAIRNNRPTEMLPQFGRHHRTDDDTFPFSVGH